MTHITLDEKLITGIAAGDAESFQQVYTQTGSAVYGFALSILKDRYDAEDVMHDTFIKVYQGADAYRPMGKPLAWILTITRNLCYDRLRNQPVSESLDEITEPADHSGRMEHHVETSLLLDMALRVLDEEEREIVMLHSMAGWKHRETAALLELPLSTVLSKYNRALKKMRTELEGKSGS